MDGFLLIDKPSGLTSHDVVDRIRRRLRVKQVGHAGTLDPLATGLLVCAVGSATRTLEYLSPHDKEYEGTLRLGYETDTGDVSGTIRRTSPLDPRLTRSAIAAAAARLVGDIEQVPPVYSSVKVGGRPAHRRVRSGEEVDLPPRQVRVTLFEVGSWSPPDGVFRVVCSTGTYVRSLVTDLGRSLGCGATLAALRRVRIGPHHLKEALTLDRLGAGTAEEHLRPMDLFLGHLPRLVVRSESERRLRTGTTCGAEDLADPQPSDAALGAARCTLGAGDPAGACRFAGIASIESLQPLVFRLHKNFLSPP